jgi:lipopolysaccharide transport system permease protein
MQSRPFLDLLAVKTVANLKAEVSRYYLNFLWWLIEPILTMAVFYLVFGVLLQRRTPDFVAFLLCGLTAWFWFNRTITNAAQSISNSRRLMQQVDIPKVFFPLEVFMQDAFKHFFVLTVLLIFLYLYPTPDGATWLALPMLLVIQATLTLGIAILVAAIVPFIPDLRFVVATLLHLMFFASGIFFDIETMVPEEYRGYVYLNPMAGLIQAYRDILIYDRWPDWLYLFIVFGLSLLILRLAISVLRRLDHVYPRLQ